MDGSFPQKTIIKIGPRRRKVGDNLIPIFRTDMLLLSQVSERGILHSRNEIRPQNVAVQCPQQRDFTDQGNARIIDYVIQVLGV